MSQNSNRRYRPERMAAGATLKGKWQTLGGFIPDVTGTVTVTDAAGNVLLNAFPLTAGVPVAWDMIVANVPANANNASVLTGDQQAIVALTTAAGVLLVA